MHSHAWPNYSRYRRGVPSVLPSSMDGLWSGEYVAQEEKVRWPELFLYSKSDFYLPYEHLEQEVLAKRKALGRDYRTVRQVIICPALSPIRTTHNILPRFWNCKGKVCLNQRI